MPLLGVNIDHVATLRQARQSTVPDVLSAALAAVSGGADSITVHLREDRRHIQDRDVAQLKSSLPVRLNMEMAATEEMVRVARVVQPSNACFVPERRQELTTEGGLAVREQARRLPGLVEKLRKKSVVVSFFINPDPELVLLSKECGAQAVELHTGPYAQARTPEEKAAELSRLALAAQTAREAGLILNAGHGLTLENVGPVALLPGMNELNIGFSIIAQALFVGLEEAVRQMKKVLAAPPA